MVASTGKKLGKSDLKQEEILQAVVAADNFNDRFAPITKDHPWVLMPLVNRPLIDYTLQYLCNEGVQETFIFCGSHTDKIRDYIKESKWSDPKSKMSVIVISSEDYLSVGDMIRDLDAKALIRSDFVLLDGATVANMPLRPIIDEHRKTVARDKGALMTLVYRRLPPWHRRRCREDDSVVAVNPETGKLLHHIKSSTTSKCDFPLSIFQGQSRVSLHHDLQDCRIAVCSPHVPPIFADNFDYQTRLDFVRGILEHEEIMGNSIYTHISNSHYAASACNLVMYDAISQDVLQRWTHPLVPDLFLKEEEREGGPVCIYHRDNIYKPVSGLQLSRSSILEPSTFVGSGTKIGDNTIVANSVIGKNCTIGQNVELRNAYLWDNVVVEDGCRLQQCLLATGVLVKRNVTISPGCVLSFGVVVGPDIHLKKGTLLQSTPDTDGFEDEPANVEECDPALVGKEGRGFLCRLDQDEEDEDNEEVMIEDVWGQPPPPSEDEDSAPEEEDISTDGTTSPVDDTKLFYNEVVESLQRGVEENVKCDNLILEINSSRYAYNIAMRGVIAVVTRVVLEMPLLLGSSGGGEAVVQQPSAAEYGTKLRKCLAQFRALLHNYIRDSESMADCLLGIEEFVAVREQYSAAVGPILNWMYDQELLSEEAITGWFREHDPSTPGPAGLARKAVDSFLPHLLACDELLYGTFYVSERSL
uniref:Translation initiation factor eIF2B subunit epsilon n=1 Tax=Amblyomma triste TaxID=251400 RepID=A0A023GD56_AMBTT